jgi:hypothetical protein
MTRGFINVMKWGSRAARLDREVNRRHDKAIALLFMVGASIESCSCKVGYLVSQALRLLDSYTAGPGSVSKCWQIPANFS